MKIDTIAAIPPTSELGIHGAAAMRAAVQASAIANGLKEPKSSVIGCYDRLLAMKMSRSHGSIALAAESPAASNHASQLARGNRPST